MKIFARKIILRINNIMKDYARSFRGRADI